MRTSSAALALVAASGALAQLSTSLMSTLGMLSPSCQQTVLSLSLNSNISQCLHISEMIPVIASAVTSNTSLIPVLDKLTAIECAQSGCSNATLISTAQLIGSGCATDLQQYNITNGTLRTIMAQYPLAREIVCLKTTKPYNATAAPIALTNPPYNVTNGTAYCTTSVLTEVSAVVGRNLSIPFFTDLYKSYMNNTLSSYGAKFNTSLLCNDCVFAAADLLGVAYPAIANATLSSVGFKNITVNSMNISNTTVAAALNSTCSAGNYSHTTNGSLPSTIRLGAVNSTFSFNLTAGGNTTVGTNSTNPIRRNVANIKARWIGA